LVDSSSAKLVQQLNEREKLLNPAWILYIIAVAVCIWGLTLADGPNVADAYVLCLAGFVALIAAVAVHRKNTEKRVTRLVYELDTAQTQNYSAVQAALGQLAQCHRIWRVQSRSFNADWKRNAGVSSLECRTSVAVGTAQPPRVVVNVPVYCLRTEQLQLFFLPDVILCLSRGQYGAVSYSDFQVEHGTTTFIENEERVPSDSTVVATTWRFVNKNGGPDRRFNNNVQIPIAQYGVLVFTSPMGLNVHLYTSSVKQSSAFWERWNQLRTQSPRWDERKAGPAKELRALADEKMNEISAAYNATKESGSSPREIDSADDYSCAEAVIRRHCENEWPDDFSMCAHCIQQQSEAVLKLRSGQPGDVPEDVFRRIRSKCAMDWPDDYVMRAHCQKEQVAGYRKVNRKRARPSADS
jgi:hypothetical protein